MFPAPLQACPLLQRPVAHITVPFGFGPPPQQAFVERQKSPVRRHPSTGWHTMAPEPGSTHVREQQLVPPEQGLPSSVHPPPPPPVTVTQYPAPPSLAEQTLPQQSLSLRHKSPLAWQL